MHRLRFTLRLFLRACVRVRACVSELLVTGLAYCAIFCSLACLYVRVRA